MRPELGGTKTSLTDRPPLRVLLITEASSAGVGRHVTDLARGLLELGCDVRVIYSPLRIDEPFERAMAALGEGRATSLWMRRAPHPEDLRIRRDLKRYLRAHGPFDVLHAHSSKAGLVARTARSKAILVYTPHCIYTMNPEAGWMMRRATMIAERFLAGFSDAIVAVSPEEEQHMRSIGIEGAAVRYIPNGIAEPRWEARDRLRAELGFADDEVVIGFLGRLSPQKNPGMLVRSFSRLAHGHERARLCIVGDGPLAAETRSLARELGVDQRIVWTGYREPENVMPAFDVFALPSRYEGMPYVLLEALSAGLPIVSTPVGGAGVTVEDGENGFVSAGMEADAFARALRPVLEDGALRARQGARSLVKSARFTAREMVQTTYELYRERIEARTPALQP